MSCHNFESGSFCNQWNVLQHQQLLRIKADKAYNSFRTGRPTSNLLMSIANKIGKATLACKP